MLHRGFAFNPARDIRNILSWWDVSYRASTPLGAADDPPGVSRILTRAGYVDGVDRVSLDWPLRPVLDTATGRMVLTQAPHDSLGCISNERGLAAFSINALSIVLCSIKPANNDTGGYYSFFGGTGQDSHHAYSDGNVYDDFASTTRQQFTHVCDFTGRHVISTRSRNGQWDFWCDGVNQYSTTSNTFSVSGAVPLGIKIPRTASPAGILTCELFLIGRYITDDEMHALIRYLAAKWKVPLTSAPHKARTTAKFGRRIFPAASVAAPGYRARVVRWG